MTTKKKSIPRIALLRLGALLIGLPAGAALAAPPDESIVRTLGEPRPVAEAASADEVMNADEADARGRHYQQQAERYQALGGVAYKTGLVQRAEADAGKHFALAERLRAPAVTVAPRSPEAERYAELAERYRRLGGVGYKTGLVQWAEAQERRYEPAPVDLPRAFEGRWDWRWGKPVERSLAR